MRSGCSSCSADLHREQRWRSQHESPDGGHSGGRDLESECSCLSNAAHSITGTAHAAVQQFITRDASNVHIKQMVQGYICQKKMNN